MKFIGSMATGVKQFTRKTQQFIILGKNLFYYFYFKRRKSVSNSIMHAITKNKLLTY